MPSAVAALAGCSINQQETCTLTEAFTGSPARAATASQLVATDDGSWGGMQHQTRLSRAFNLASNYGVRFDLVGQDDRKDKGREEAFSDGVLLMAINLLALDLHVQATG